MTDGDDVAAEVVAAAVPRGVAAELLEEEPGGEDVDAHRGQAVVRVAGDRLRLGRLLLEADDAAARCRPASRRTAGSPRPATRSAPIVTSASFSMW